MIGPLEHFTPRTPHEDPERAAEIAYQEVKQRVHEQIVASLDLAVAAELSREVLINELQLLVDEILWQDESEIDAHQRQRLTTELPQEMFGLGPLESLLSDPDINDILVNHAHEVFVERRGRLCLTKVLFANDRHLLRIIQRIVSQVGRRIDESHPFVDARLGDGSRIHAIIPPLALDGPKLSIRRFRELHCSLKNLVANQTLSPEMADFLRAAVQARKSILISGGTGSGKTTMLNALSSCIPDSERIVTIEDSAELRLQHRHVVRLETRPANSEEVGQFDQRDLVRNSLRMRPDRIIVGEVRGAEALDMLQAMNTGHEGSLTTIHANNPEDSIARLEMMVAMTGIELPHAVVRSYICSGIDLAVHLSRLPGGERRVMSISELGKQKDSIRLQEVFRYRRTGVDETGVSIGSFEVGSPPDCLRDFEVRGITFAHDTFGAIGTGMTTAHVGNSP